MPNVPPGAPIAPGTAQGNTYPQYGVSGGTPGSAQGWHITVAANGGQKMQDIQNGVLTWFSSRAAAQSYISSESSAAGSGTLPPISGLAAIGDFFARLTEANTWIRVGEFLAGGIILYVGLKAIVTPPGQKVSHQTAVKTLHRAASLTPAGRAANTASRAKRVVNPRTNRVYRDAAS